MRVTRIEIFGFKSFMERLILPLDAGVTGVVGPNGCGKSNIVDALRWVLGETKARNLRGGVLEDVIFNGTDKLRPLGLAEVSLTLRSRGESLFDDIVEVDSETEILTELAAAELEVKQRNKDLKATADALEGSGSEAVAESGINESEESPSEESPEPQREGVLSHEEIPDERSASGEIGGNGRPKLTVILGKRGPAFEGHGDDSEGVVHRKRCRRMNRPSSRKRLKPLPMRLRKRKQLSLLQQR